MEKDHKIIVFGKLGTGKSTFLNAAVGSEDKFKVGDDFEGITQTFDSFQVPPYTFVDSPGLHDPNINLVEWFNRLKKSLIIN